MTKQNISYLSDLHFNYRQWQSELSFWENEIDFFEKQLGEVVQQYQDNEILSKAEHFQNVFLLHRETIDALEDRITNHEEQMALIMKADPKEVNRKYFEDHSELKEKLDTQRKLFRELKNEYFLFISRIEKD